jgi:hypothetical protein
VNDCHRNPDELEAQVPFPITLDLDDLVRLKG